MTGHITTWQYLKYPIQLTGNLMNTDCGNLSFGCISASGDVREECIPDYGGQLLAISALIEGMFVCGCGKYNISYRKVTDDVWEKC